MRPLACLLLLLSAGSSLAGGPAGAVAAAAKDVEGLAPADQPYARYLSIYAVPEKDRPEFLKVFAFHLNSLSREHRLSHPRLVTPDLLAVDARWYGWDLGVWERLGDIDPYFHFEKVYEEAVIEERLWPGGTFTDGKQYEAGVEKVRRKRGDKAVQAAPWLPTADVLKLRKATYSETPVLRADWFFVQTAVQKNRVAGYYAWLGLTKRADFERLTGLDIKLAQQRKSEVAAIIQKSGIAIRNRQVFRFGAVDGGYWLTRDALNSQVRGQNAINNLDKDFKHNAERHYGFLGNGLFAYYLCDNDGVQQDSAPDEVGADQSATFPNDGKVHVGKSCITCHTEGLKPLDDYARKTFVGAVKISAPNYKQFQRLEQLYLGEYQEKLERDNVAFANALVRLNGADWTPAVNAKKYGRVWRQWAEDDVTLEGAALEAGVDKTTLVAALKRHASPPPAGAGNLPLVFGAFLKEQPGVMLREHYDEQFGLIQFAIRGYQPAAEIKKGK